MRPSVLQLVAISAYIYFEFLISFLALKRRWYITLLRWTAPILAGVGPTILLVGGHGWMIGSLRWRWSTWAAFFGSSAGRSSFSVP